MPSQPFSSGAADDESSHETRYEIRGFLGAGGMGQVYRAWDRSLRREVAFKVLRNADPQAEARALREARLQTRVEHPSVCRILDVGHQDGRIYVAMELIEGPTLADATERMSLEQKLRCLSLACRGVHAAHLAGLVHRDLKPSNILLRDDAPDAEPVVVDFGLARALTAVDPDNAEPRSGAERETLDRLTRTGHVLGTPAYMSPEQVRGDRDLDARADIYSLGCMLFELVTGQTPFSETSQIELMMSVVNRPAPRLRMVSPSASPTLELMVEACLEKEVGARYSSARALGDDLEKYLDGEPISLATPGPWTRLRLWARHHPSAARRLSASLLVLLLTLGATVVWLGEKAQRQIEAQAAQQFGARAERLASSLRIARLSPAHDLSAVKNSARREIESLRADADSLGPWGLPAARYALGVASLGLGELEQAQGHLETAWLNGNRRQELARALVETLIRRFASEVERLPFLRDSLREVEFERLKGEYLDKVRDVVDSAESEMIAEISADPNPQPDLFLAALVLLAEHDLPRALAAFEATLAADSGRWEALEFAGHVHRLQGIEADLAGREDESVRSLRLAIDSFTRAGTIARSDERVFTKACLASSTALNQELRAGRLPQVEMPKVCATALQLDPTMADPYLARGALFQRIALADYRASRDFEEPLRQAHQELQQALDLASGDASVTVSSLLAVQLLMENDLTSWHEGDASAGPLEAAAAHARRALGLDPEHIQALVTLGQVLWTQAEQSAGDTEATAEYFGQAQAVLQRATEVAPKLAQAHSMLAIVYDGYSQWMAETQEGDPAPWLEKARTSFQRALELDPWNSTILVNLGITYLYETDRSFYRGENIEAIVRSGDEVFRRAIDLSPERAVLHYNRADLLTYAVRDALSRQVDATPWMEQASRAHEVAFLAEPIEYGCSKGKLEWLQAKVDQVAGRDPRPALRRGREAIDAVLALHPASWRCLRDRARLGLESFRAEGDPAKLEIARRDVEASLESQEENDELWWLMAEFDLAEAEMSSAPGLRRERARAAIEALDRADRLRPGFWRYERLRLTAQDLSK